MDTLDYQLECGLTRYPFKDSAALYWSGTGGRTGVLPNTVIRDARLSIFDGTTTNLRLVSIDRENEGWYFNFAGAAFFHILIPHTTGINTYSARSVDENKILCIDIDNDALAAYFIDIPNGSYIFENNCWLCLSCLRLSPPKITRLRLTNMQSDGAIINVFDTDSTPDLYLREGTNTGFTLSGSNCAVEIIRGAGIGQYNGCPEPGSQILTINNISPDSRGNFLFSNDMCYSTYTGLQGLHLKNICKPRCTSEEIINMADYYNRVTDLANQLATYVSTTNTNYNDWLEHYEALELEKMSARNPYIIACANNLSNRANQFHNITVGIYSPGLATVQGVLTLKASGAEYQVVDGTAYILTDGLKTALPTPSLAGGTATLMDRALTCGANVCTGLVLQQAAAIEDSHTNAGSSLYDATFTLTTSSTGKSGYVLPLNPKTFNYTIAYTLHYVYDEARENIVSQIIKLDVGLTDPAQLSGIVSLKVDSGILGQVKESKLIFDGIPTILDNAGFINQSVDFKGDNHYYLTLVCPPTQTGSYDIKFLGTGITGSASKTLTINL